MLILLENYLKNRKQSCFEWNFSTGSGVPQGSVLGPLLFLIYINDLEEGIISKIKFFADDTMVYSIVQNPLQTAADLNHDLDLISKWTFQWKMSFNHEPSKQAVELLFQIKLRL